MSITQKLISWRPASSGTHLGLTLERDALGFLFKFNRVLVFNSTIFKLAEFCLYFFLRNAYAEKKSYVW